MTQPRQYIDAENAVGWTSAAVKAGPAFSILHAASGSKEGAPRDLAGGAPPPSATLANSERGLPLVWLGVGDDDPLVSDSLALAEKLRDAGVPHEVKVYPGLPHAFIMLNRIFTGAVLAIQDAARAAQRFVRAAVRNTPLEVR